MGLRGALQGRLSGEDLFESDRQLLFAEPVAWSRIMLAFLHIFFQAQAYSSRDADRTPAARSLRSLLGRRVHPLDIRRQGNRLWVRPSAFSRGLLSGQPLRDSVWSQALMVHSYRTIRRMRYGSSFTRLRRHDGGSPSSNAK